MDNTCIGINLFKITKIYQIDEMAKYTLYVNFKLIRRKQFDVEVYVIIIDKIMQVAFTYF